MKTLKLRLTDLLEISDLLLKANKIQLRAITGSMSPIIREGDLLQIEPTSIDKLYPGDILLYHNQGQLICHRLVKKYQEMDKIYVITKADRSSIFDPPFPTEQVLGRVVNIKKASWVRYIWLSEVKIRVRTLLLRALGIKCYQWLRRFYHGKVVTIERKQGGVINLETKSNRLFAYFIAYLSWALAILKEAIISPSQFLKRVRNYFFRQKGKMEDEYLVQSIAGVTSGNRFCPEFHSSNRFKDDFVWDYLLNSARKNGVSPLLYFYQKEEKESFPKNFFNELEKDYYQTLTSNILIWEEIKPILKSLEEKKIEVILLKGIALGVTIYSSPGLRPMSDVDILIKDEDIFKVDETLNRLGYFSGDTRPQDIELGKVEYLTTLYYRGKNLSLHLHWHLVNSTIPNFSYISKINMERIWRKARLIEISGIKALSLSPEHLIIYLCEHSLRVTHSLSSLIFLADISQAINYYQGKIDWDFLVKESYNFGLERMVYCGLYSVNRILRTEVSSDILSFLKPKRLTLGEKVFLSLVARNRSSPGLSYLVHLAMNKRPLEKIKFIFRTFFPPKKVLGQGNCIPPSKINYFHYLSRLKRVLRHALISIAH